MAPDRGHSVVALVWYPGQRTPIHDHVSWCVVGVYEGEESRTLYHLAEDHSEPGLVETGRETARPGNCTSLIPPAENIRRVANAGSGRAISIHVVWGGHRAPRLEHQQDLRSPGHPAYLGARGHDRQGLAGYLAEVFIDVGHTPPV